METCLSSVSRQPRDMCHVHCGFKPSFNLFVPLNIFVKWDGNFKNKGIEDIGKVTQQLSTESCYWDTCVFGWTHSLCSVKVSIIREAVPDIETTSR